MGTGTQVVVIGSGFGGSVAALRLAEKGYQVTVLEAGRRFADDELPTTSWDLRSFLWAPRLGCYGIQRIHLLRDVLVLAGAGVGGGSLNYANTLYRPASAAFYEDPQWAHVADWRTELAPYYDLAERMLGVVDNPSVTPADEVMGRVAERMGVGHTRTTVPVGVHFGRDGQREPDQTHPDPFFGGVGPDRTGCNECGSCMTGCRVGAKNTLVKNYLHLAERAGARVEERTTVIGVRPATGGGYVVRTVRTSALGRLGRRRELLADQVIFAAGAYGTSSLLHRLRADGSLPRLSPRLGDLARTNSEALGGAMAPPDSGADFTRGVAITSSFHPAPDTHIEPVRYGKGSNAMMLLTTLAATGPTRGVRARAWAREVLTHPRRLVSLYDAKHWSERSVITLTMQSRDNSLRLRLRRGLFGATLTSEQGHGEPNPSWIPQAARANELAAQDLGGFAAQSLGEVADIPMTAHFLGGCVIGDSPETGVVDPWQRVYGYPGLHVVDGSAVSANLGVNPSLTITAQAERAMAMWPNAGEADPRPALGAAYRPVAPVAAQRPAVPPHAQIWQRPPAADAPPAAGPHHRAPV